MKFFILFVATIGIFAKTAIASEVYKNDKCYKKVVNCCFNWGGCGFVPKTIPNTYSCDFKKCENKCKKVCHDACKDVTETIPKKVCVPEVKQVCTKSADYYGGWIAKCKKVTTGERCTTTNTYKTKKVCNPYCENKCDKVCFTVKASCTKVKSVKYAKSCATLTCEKEALVGDAGNPGDHVSEKELFVSESKPVRKVYGKK